MGLKRSGLVDFIGFYCLCLVAGLEAKGAENPEYFALKFGLMLAVICRCTVLVAVNFLVGDGSFLLLLGDGIWGGKTMSKFSSAGCSSGAVRAATSEIFSTLPFYSFLKSFLKIFSYRSLTTTVSLRFCRASSVLFSS